MYRPAFSFPTYSYPSYSYRRQQSWPCLIGHLTLWICVLITIKYGYYGSSHLVLGPNSSRLLLASSIFIEKIQVRDDAKKGLVLYGFSEKPKLSIQSNWNVSKYLLVGTYRRRGFSLWLNKGSRIHITWEAHIKDFNALSLALIKGERKFVTVKPSNPTTTFDSTVLNNLTYGNGQAEYLIEEDDSYYIIVANTNPRSIIMTVNVNVSSTMYDTTKAESKCSTINGLCQLKLQFPKSHYFILTTVNNGDSNGWVIGLSFVARLVTYIAILGFVVFVICFILKYLGACEGNRPLEEVTVTEADPLTPPKSIEFTYGTEEDAECGIGSSSEDLYDGKICVICYDEQRNCFFIPCGHCATCYECAQRIMLDADNKVCPICRRFIHKVRRLFTP